MQPSRTLFFVIIGLAIVAVVIMFLANQFLADSLDLPTDSGNVAIEVVVAPDLEDWARQAAQDFSQANPNIQVNIIATNELIPESEFSASKPIPPAAWLAEASFVVEMANSNSGLQFNDSQSVASSPMAWGAFTDKQEAFTQQYGPLSWDSLHAKAMAQDDFLTIVLASPDKTASGLAALISATAAHLDKQTLSGVDVDQASSWLSETFRENTRIPSTPAEAFATATGRSIGDLGMLPQRSWNRVGLQNKPDFTITPGQPAVVLDYPLAIWSGSRSTPEAQQAAAAFRDFLLSEPQQNALAAFHLDKAQTVPANSVQADGPATLALLRWAERELR